MKYKNVPSVPDITVFYEKKLEQILHLLNVSYFFKTTHPSSNDRRRH